MPMKLGKFLLVLWFAFLTSCGSVVVVWQSSNLCGYLNQPRAYQLVEGHKEWVVGLGLLLFIGIAGWMLAETFRGRSPLDGAGFFGNVVYVTCLAVGLGFLAASVVIPIVVLAWGFRLFLDERWALPLSAILVLPPFFYFGRKRKPRPKAAATPAPPGATPASGNPPGSRPLHRNHRRR